MLGCERRTDVTGKAGSGATVTARELTDMHLPTDQQSYYLFDLLFRSLQVFIFSCTTLHVSSFLQWSWSTNQASTFLDLAM